MSFSVMYVPVVCIPVLVLQYFFLKGYLRYKTIMSSEALLKNFLFRRKVMFRSQDFQDIFNHSMIYQIFDIIMSIST